MKNKKNFTIDEVKKFPPSFLIHLINTAKKYIKKDEVMQNTFKEYGVPIDEIDFIPTYFKDIDVSASTNHGVVWLNYKLLTDGNFSKDYSYLIHEYTHFLQQTCGDKPTKGSDDGDYLDNSHEIEGFQNQLEYIANEFGDDEAHKYVDHLLEHHDVEDKEEKVEKKEELLAKV